MRRVDISFNLVKIISISKNLGIILTIRKIGRIIRKLMLIRDR